MGEVIYRRCPLRYGIDDRFTTYTLCGAAELSYAFISGLWCRVSLSRYNMNPGNDIYTNKKKVRKGVTHHPPTTICQKLIVPQNLRSHVPRGWIGNSEMCFLRWQRCQFQRLEHVFSLPCPETYLHCRTSWPSFGCSPPSMTKPRRVGLL